jgi:hypothetical protein
VSLVCRADDGGAPEMPSALMESRLLHVLAEEVRVGGTCGGGGRILTAPGLTRPWSCTPLVAQHQAFRAWLRVLQARLVSDGVADAAGADTGASLPASSFPAAVDALRRAAAAHYFPGGRASQSRSARPAPDARGSDDDDDGDGGGSGGSGDGSDGARWWAVACKVLAEYALAVAPAGGAAAAHSPHVAALPLPDAAERVLRQHGVSFATSLVLGAQRDVLDIDCIGSFLAWSAPRASQEGASAEMAEIKTSSAGAHVLPVPPHRRPCAHAMQRQRRARAERVQRLPALCGARARRLEQGERASGGSLPRARACVRCRVRAAQRVLPARRRHRVLFHAQRQWRARLRQRAR